MRKYRSFLLPLALILSIPACAQVDRSALTGTITDPAGKLLPDTTITAVDNATQLERQGKSDAAGRYDIAELPVGKYTITFDHAGFKTLTFLDVEQVVGRTRTLDATLPVSGDLQRVEVAASSELMDHNSSAVTGLIESKQVDELPLNGRNWASLTAFVPGAIDTGGSNQRTIRFAGRGLDDSNFTYDGVDATNIVNQTQRHGCGSPFPGRNRGVPRRYTAGHRRGRRYGRSPIGRHLAFGHKPIPRSPVRVPAQQYLRRARAASWASNGEAQQPLRLNQFGGSVGGPIMRDKTFFFLASEAYRQVWGYPVSGDVPSAAFKATVPSILPVYASSMLTRQQDRETFLTPYTPATDPGDPHYADYDLLTCSCTQVVNENSAMLRLDQHFTDRPPGLCASTMTALPIRSRCRHPPPTCSSGSPLR